MEKYVTSINLLLYTGEKSNLNTKNLQMCMRKEKASDNHSMCTSIHARGYRKNGINSV